jgi:hypothetical protein
MTEYDWHEYMANEWAKQRPRPGSEAFKNRNHIQAKLPDDLYQKAWTYCQINSLSFNSLTRKLYELFFNQING